MILEEAVSQLDASLVSLKRDINHLARIARLPDEILGMIMLAYVRPKDLKALRLAEVRRWATSLAV